VEPLQGRELWTAKQVVAEVTHRIRFRHLSGVVPTQRVVFGSRTFEILSVINPEERNRELELLCKEVN
jgi:SPP1 family predicted phage head-tail adaptor